MKSRLHIDWLLLAPAFILVIISLTTLFSINIAYFKSQFFSLVVAILFLLFFTRINLEVFKQFKKQIYLVALILLVITFLIGVQSHGAVRWIDFLGTRLQFSEVLKPFLAIAFSAMIADSAFSRKKTFFLALLFLLPIVLLIVLQPDLGSGLLYLFVGLLVLLISGFPLSLFGLAVLPFLIVSPLIWTFLHDYQRQRVLTFIHPASDPLGRSYNSIQAIIAVGSGNFFGRGWFQGTQSSLRFLPERHTDFIFATLSEGIGFIGSVFVVLAFSFLCYRVYKIFKDSDDQFSKLLSLCGFGFFFIQGFVNIGMNIGYLPVVGIPLPFVSFGGNSLLSNFIFLGILSAISSRQRSDRVLEIR